MTKDRNRTHWSVMEQCTSCGKTFICRFVGLEFSSKVQDGILCRRCGGPVEYHIKERNRGEKRSVSK